MLSTRKFLPYLPVGVLALLFALWSEWNDDAIAYSFFIPRYGEDESFIPITSLKDIWDSQVNHYFNANGRFVVHFIVQIFCGILSKYWFAIANAAVWMALAYNIANFNNTSSRFKVATLSSILSILLFFPLPFTPPFQINYVWVSCAIVIWLRWFFSKREFSTLQLILTAIGSFLIGEMHEGFSVPVGGALLFYLIYRKGRLTLREWCLSIPFSIGALISILSPGNFGRMALGSSAGSSYLNLIEQLPAIIWFPLILLIFICINGDISRIRQYFSKPITLFLFAAIVTSLLFNLCLGKIGRGILPYNLCFVLLTIVYVHNKNIPVSLIAVGAAIACCVIIFQGFRVRMQNLKTESIFREYSQSESGTIFIENRLFLFNKEETTQRRNTYTNRLRQQNPAKPFLVIYPQSMKHIDFKKDSNIVVKVGAQSWVCIQSASDPRNFVVRKTLLPSTLKREMSPRILDFSSESDIFIDSTSQYRSILYVNDRPYVDARVIIE